MIYQIAVSISGIPTDGMLLFMGSFLLIVAVFNALFFFSLSGLPTRVLSGDLDLLLVKPVEPIFLISLRQVDLSITLPNFIGGLVMVVLGWSGLRIPLDPLNLSGYLLLCVGGLVSCYSIMCLPSLMAFWFGRATALREVSDSLLEFNTLPMTLYPKWIQSIGTVLFPIFLISNWGPLFLLQRLDLFGIAWGLCGPVLLFAATMGLWKAAIRRYTSGAT